MESIIGVIICVSPILFAAMGYFIGRYGLPIEIRRRPLRDRRSRMIAPDDTEEVYVTGESATNLRIHS